VSPSSSPEQPSDQLPLRSRRILQAVEGHGRDLTLLAPLCQQLSDRPSDLAGRPSHGDLPPDTAPPTSLWVSPPTGVTTLPVRPRRVPTGDPGRPVRWPPSEVIASNYMR
jgi:hypothetical protein